ncbi:hypothetical protein NDU88_005471 [Pleurodeles waltl]|uniref:Cdc42 effector-like domain-containing protein n=2 Tax=Pleurodeles waltl TaxID=8319 RepID=A0AAV7TAT4_PLEWA|nr:hypothetical protein NDU88_005471 [Pleurodeles waltl]
MHVGRGGEVFGDTSFLSEHGGNAAESPSKGGFFSRTLRHVRSPLRGRGGSIKSETVAITYPPPPVSPIIKNAVSLPQLNEIANGGSERFTYKSAPINNTSENMYHYGLESGFCTIPRLSRQERTPEPSYALEDPEEPESEDLELDTEGCDSLQSFHLDFGPSLMSEVFGGMGFPASIAEEEEEEEHGWGYSQSGNPGGTMTNGHFAQQPQESHRERCAERVANHQASWEHTSHLQDTVGLRVNGVGRHEPPQAVPAADHNGFKRDTDSVTKPTPSPRRQRESRQMERPGLPGDQEHTGAANPDLKAETAPQAQPPPLPTVGMRPGEFSRVARVLDHHYGATPGDPCTEELEEAVLPLPQEEDETKAPAPKASRVYLALRGGAFAYAEEEEDDEVKL